MPSCLCGTVYSRNSLALAGILALNAGHVDPGYKGPIAIRLINLRATPWTLTLGQAIFTITFQTVDPNPCDPAYPESTVRMGTGVDTRVDGQGKANGQARFQ